MGPDKDFIIVLTTFPIEKDAEGFARTLVEERLAACVNILPAMKSIYAWKGVIERSDERQLLIKTTTGQITALEARIRTLHPHDIPEFVVLRIDSGSADYLSWLSDSTNDG